MKRLPLCACLLLLGATALVAQVRKGVVIDNEGTPLPGVSIKVEGKSVGTVTDANGEFRISAEDADKLVFSFIGMATQVVSVGNQKTIDVTMSPNVERLDDVTVVAYGTAKKEALTGAVSQINSETIEKKTASNVTNSLVGEVAGLQLVTGSGQPGDISSIRLRGIGSLSASASPLYVVDGIPYDGSINTIDPGDIESITVLKDASSTALYGARGANGVILLTTKKGKKGTSNVEVELILGLNDRWIPDYDVITEPKDYYELTWEALRNRNLANNYSAKDAATKASNELVSEVGGYNNYNVPDSLLIGTDGKLNPAARLRYKESWYNELFRRSWRREAKVRLSGGSSKTTYYSAISFLDDGGYYVNSNFSRFSSRVLVNHQVKPWLKALGSVAYSRAETNAPITNLNAYQNGFAFARYVPPIYPVYFRDPKTGERVYEKGQPRYDFGESPYSRKIASLSNPVATTVLDVNRTDLHAVNSRGSLEATFLKDFKLISTWGFDFYLTQYQNLLNSKYGAAKGLGRAYRTDNRYFTYTWNQLLKYKHDFRGHIVEAMIGHENRSYNLQYLYGNKSKTVATDNVELANAVVLDGLTSARYDRRLESYFAEMKWEHRKRYYLHLTYRLDGSSRFPNDPWGHFGAAGVAWRISQEGFLSSLSWLDELKYKTSYGLLGNEDIGLSYPTYDHFSISNNNDNPAISFTSKGNPDLTWETTHMFNTGLEMTLFKKLTIETDFFIKQTNNLIYYKAVPLSLGYSSLPVNDGAIRNTGIEFLVKYQAIDNNDLKVKLSLNGASYKNEIVEMPLDVDGKTRKKVEARGQFLYEKGRSIYDFYMDKYAGVDPQTGKAQWWGAYYENKNKQKIWLTSIDARNRDTLPALTWAKVSKKDSATETFLNKSAIPALQGAFTIDVEYKGFDLSLQLGYQIGGYIYDGVYARLMDDHTPGARNWHKDILNRWQKAGDQTDVPKLTAGSTQDIASRQDRFVTDASYLSLNNVMMGYNFPKRWLKKVKVEKLRLYVSASNLFVWTARRGLLPNQSFDGTADNRYSPMSTLSGGIKIVF